jgi:antitoxin PrlF
LGLGKRDKIRYTIRPSGEVVLTRVGLEQDEDPVLAQFLQFLAQDMGAHPERLQGVDSGLIQRLDGLVANVRLDLDAPLHEDDE